MIISLHPVFIKHYRKRISPNPQLRDKARQRIELFKNDRINPVLRDHQLTGVKRHLRSFWITGDIRIVYYPLSDERVLFLDIGSHNQVY